MAGMTVVADEVIRIATLHGAVVILQPGVEKTLSESLGLEALKAGAKQVSKAGEEAVPAPPVEEEPELSEPSPGDVLKGIMDLVDLSDPRDFKGDGAPKAAALNRVVGRVVRTDEREAAWEAFLNS